SPALQAGDASFDGCASGGQGPVDRLLGCGEFAMGRPALGGGDPLARADVGRVGKDGDALALTDPDDLVCAGGGQVVCASGQGRREPQRPAVRVRDDLHVHTVPLALGRVVRASVADPVALGERAVHENVVGVCLAQDLQQARRLVREVLDDGGDVRVGGADGNTETCGQLRQGVVSAQVCQSDHRTLGRPEFAASVTLVGDDQHRHPLHECVRQVECGRIWDQQGS
ncbi:hypothetical protein STRIP9103_09699, partial [Streptomyces ipomoeae 91-03]